MKIFFNFYWIIYFVYIYTYLVEIWEHSKQSPTKRIVRFQFLTRIVQFSTFLKNSLFCFWYQILPGLPSPVLLVWYHLYKFNAEEWLKHFSLVILQSSFFTRVWTMVARWQGIHFEFRGRKFLPIVGVLSVH